MPLFQNNREQLPWGGLPPMAPPFPAGGSQTYAGMPQMPQMPAMQMGRGGPVGENLSDRTPMGGVLGSPNQRNRGIGLPQAFRGLPALPGMR